MKRLIHAVVRDVLAREQRKITRRDLEELERMLDAVFHRVGIDIEFTRHFLERVNHVRNKEQITLRELQEMFMATFRQHSRKLRQYGDRYTAVLVDLNSQINIPFVLEWNSSTEMLELRNKTVMRTPHFRAPNQKLIVRS